MFGRAVCVLAVVALARATSYQVVNLWTASGCSGTPAIQTVTDGSSCTSYGCTASGSGSTTACCSTTQNPGTSQIGVQFWASSSTCAGSASTTVNYPLNTCVSFAGVTSQKYVVSGTTLTLSSCTDNACATCTTATFTVGTCTEGYQYTAGSGGATNNLCSSAVGLASGLFTYAMAVIAVVALYFF